MRILPQMAIIMKYSLKRISRPQSFPFLHSHSGILPGQAAERGDPRTPSNGGQAVNAILFHVLKDDAIAAS